MENSKMRKLNAFTTRLAALLIFHAAGAGHASPAVLVSRPSPRAVQWLPIDNQTLYRLPEGQVKSLELNTSFVSSAVHVIISPCSKDVRWGLYRGQTANKGQLSLVRENTGSQMATLSIIVLENERYVLQLSSEAGGAAAVSVRGEAPRPVRLRLRVRSRRRLAANWDPSPIDPQSTSYCIVASHRTNYTSLCAAQLDSKSNRIDCNNRIINTGRRLENTTDNKIELDADSFIYEGSFNSIYRRKKFGRSTKVTDEDPLIACVGERTHHLIENLDPSTTYYVSVFGVASDRRAGTLLATGSVRPRNSTAKKLRENVPYRSDIRTKSVYYFKASVGSSLWLSTSTCGGAVDVEVLVRGKRIYLARNIDRHQRFSIDAPTPPASFQETSDEGSVQFDSSSEEAKMRYVIKVMPNRWDKDGNVGVELTASTTPWGGNALELLDESVREMRQKRTCKSVDIAFLPAALHREGTISYCVSAREISNGVSYSCAPKRSLGKSFCIHHNQRLTSRVIVQKIFGLKPGKKYTIQVTASSKGNSIPYKILYVDTNLCKGEK